MTLQYIVSGVVFTAPANIVTSSYIACIGAGGGGENGISGAGGGGGAYASISTFVLVSNTTYLTLVGAGGIGGASSTGLDDRGANGGFTWFNSSTTVMAGGGTSLGAKGSTVYAGSITSSGGERGTAPAGSGAGGGAAGLSGPGRRGGAGSPALPGGGGGGGGAGGGSSGLDGVGLVGGNGGPGPLGGGGGIGSSVSGVPGGAGSSGGGGGGGFGSSLASTAGAGGAGSDFDATHGSGGGGGGAGAVTSPTGVAQQGGAGGLYGGGGGGGGYRNGTLVGTGGAGAQGLIVVGYTAANQGNGSFLDTASSMKGQGRTFARASGSFLDVPSSMRGSGLSLSNGNGAFNAGVSSMKGSGVRLAGGIAGNGSFLDVPSSMRGSGIVRWRGQGAFLDTASSMKGSGLSKSLGQGSMTDLPSSMKGSGILISRGNGAYLDTPSSMRGSGFTKTLGAGSMVDRPSSMVGSGRSLSYGNGAFIVSPAIMRGSGLYNSGATTTSTAGVITTVNQPFVYRHPRRMRNQKRGQRSVTVASTFAPESLVLFALATNMPSSDKVLADNLITGLIAAQIWPQIDILYVTAVYSSADALLNWKSPGNFTLAPTGSSSPVFTRYKGFAGAASQTFNTGWNPSSDAVAYTLNKSHVGVYVVTAPTFGSAIYAIGARDSSGNRTLLGVGTSLQIVVDVNDTASAFPVPIDTVAGLYLAVRHSSASRMTYEEGSTVSVDTQAPTIIPQLTFDLLGRNFSGSHDAPFDGIIGAGEAGGDIPSSDAVVETALFDAYFIAVGARIKGNGGFAAQRSLMAGQGTVANVATMGQGAFIDTGSSMRGSGALKTLGQGAMLARASSERGSGAVLSKGNGAFVDVASSMKGGGVSKWQGQGSFVDTQSSERGSGISKSIGQGAMAAQGSSMRGSGVPKTIGAGSFAAIGSSMRGSGIKKSVGQGSFLDTGSSMRGSGSVKVIGAGSFLAVASSERGSGLSKSIGNGSFAARPSSQAGSGKSLSKGQGAFAAQAVTLRGSGSVSGARALQAETVALLARFTVTPDTTQQYLIDDVFIALKNSSLLADLDCLYVMSAHDEQAAREDWISPAASRALIRVNAPTFTPYVGEAGDAVASYLQLPTTANVMFTKASMSSGHMGVWGMSQFEAATKTLAGCQWNGGGQPSIQITPRKSPEGVLYTWCQGTWGQYTNADARGYWVVSRVSSGTVGLWLDGSSVASTAVAVTGGLPDRQLAICAYQDGNTVDQYSDQQAGALHVGKGWNSSKISLMYAALHPYMLSNGATNG